MPGTDHRLAASSDSMHSSVLVQGDRIVGQLIRAAQAPS
jgi:hypothetical protein